MSRLTVEFDIPAGFDDDANRWDQILWHLNILSCAGWSGTVMLHLDNGRVSRKSLKQVNDLARPIVEQLKKEEANCG